MVEGKKISLERPQRQRQGRRWLLAMMLGLCTWWGVSWWLEPKPVWLLPYSHNQERYSLLCENETGTLVAMFYERFSDRSNRSNGDASSDIKEVRILDGKSGIVLYHLVLPVKSGNNMFGRDENLRLVGSALWRCSVSMENGVKHYELHSWHFTKDTKERLIHRWHVPSGSPYDIRFAPGPSPYFVVRSEWPWNLD